MDGFPDSAAWVMLIPIVAMIGGFLLAAFGILSKVRQREFEHRERLAMIEKGLPPSGPTPPGGTPQGVTDNAAFAPFREPFDSHEERAWRARRGGFIVMAIGFGVGFLIWMTDREVGDAVGVGGFLLILGAAIFASSYFGRPRAGGTPPGGSTRR